MEVGCYSLAERAGPERVRHSHLCVTERKGQQHWSLSKRAGPFMYWVEKLGSRQIWAGRSTVELEAGDPRSRGDATDKLDLLCDFTQCSSVGVGWGCRGTRALPGGVCEKFKSSGIISLQRCVLSALCARPAFPSGVSAL